MTPTHAPTPCVEPGCFTLTERGGRCPSCQLLAGPSPYETARGSARERGYDKRWERRRRRHLAIEPFCRVCVGQKPGNQVDHVIPHRGAPWLFDLEGNLQTLCKHHHSTKTAHERTIPIGTMYPLDLPEPPHNRPTRLLCGPVVKAPELDEGVAEQLTIYGNNSKLYHRNTGLGAALLDASEIPLILTIAAPRTAERAFWAHIMDCEAELVMPVHNAIENHPVEWWADYMLDQRAEEAMERRGA